MRYMLQFSLKIIIVFLFCFPCFAATYYMSNTGDNSNNGSEGTPWLTLQYSIAHMNGGDTLIIKDGTYTGSGNVIDHSHMPPSGTSNNYTTIRAENVGSVIFDGENTRQMFYLYGTNPSPYASYIAFDGLTWTRSSGDLVSIIFVDHIKFTRCTTYETSGTGYMSNGFHACYCSYVLFEDCWSFGSSNYNFMADVNSDRIIFRRCVARHDRYPLYYSQASFMAYNSSNVEFQNCIALDADQTAYYTSTDGSPIPPIVWLYRDTGAGKNPVSVNYIGCISINNYSGYGAVGSNTQTNTSVNFINSILHWNAQYGNRTRYDKANFDHCVTGKISSSDTFWGDGIAFEQNLNHITNSIIYNVVNTYGYGIRGGDGTSNYNALYGNTNNYSGVSVGANDKVNTVDPIDGSPGNGVAALQYLVKIEDSSDFDGAASDSGDMGATILYQIGVSGTLYGETGYNTTTAVKMWPFPNEALIREKMRAYTYDDGSGGDPEITGARGYAASGVTLTSYILNYLEPTNEIGVTGTTDAVTVTADVDEYIYGESGETDTVDPACAISDSKPKTLSSGYTTTLGFTSSDANGIDECKWRSGSAPDESNGTACTGTTSGTCSVTGLVMGDNTIYVGCADPSNNWGSDSVTVNAPPYRASAGGSYNIR